MSDAEKPEEGFKVVGRYCYPELESVETYFTKEEAQQEARKWKKDAEAKGQYMSVRVVKS